MTFPRSSPSAQGVDPVAIVALIDAFEADPRIEPHGLIVARHGHRIAEGYWAPHAAGRPRLVYSLSKTFTGSALALQLGEGRLTLDDLVADHLPDLLHDADPRTRQLRIRHLASMSTGHDREMLLDAFVADPGDPVRGFFHLPPDHEPGSIFAYNQPPVLALATILQRLAGERVADYLRPRLLDPLGIGELRWQQLNGVDLGFSGVFTDLDAVARLGQLYLDEGVWDGTRLLPDGWVREASRPQIANPNEPDPDWQQGYGFQLWMSRHGYRGDGAFGQLMVVLPEHDAAVAVFANVADHMQAELDHVWAHLLPAMGPSPRPAGVADDALADRLAGLSLPTAGERVGGTAPRPASGELTRADGVSSHPTVTSVEVTGSEVVLHEERSLLRVPMRSAWTPVPDAAVSASATQDAGGHLVVDLVFLDTPHRLELTCDLAASTFQARWPAVPLFGVGVEPSLATMHAPA